MFNWVFGLWSWALLLLCPHGRSASVLAIAAAEPPLGSVSHGRFGRIVAILAILGHFWPFLRGLDGLDELWRRLGGVGTEWRAF